ncbi:zinc phosphodiesterase ELAC protein 2 [Brachionichthys hirsutus]|uniref:zinc phosphodiesterase ELAC protein 2 n=1 Tax=Brachionichthys hirsutus TaxID=412623 RepID=UPI003604865E
MNSVLAFLSSSRLVPVASLSSSRLVPVASLSSSRLVPVASLSSSRLVPVASLSSSRLVPVASLSSSRLVPVASLSSSRLVPVARLDSCPRRAAQFLRTMASNANSRESLGLKRTRKKEPLRRTKIKEQRSTRAAVPGAHKVCVQVVGAGSRDNPASLYVYSEYNGYLFNCGEGTQRLMQEHRLKVVRLDNIFLTRLSWQNVGGLSGMILTLKDVGVSECVLSGPPQLDAYLSAIKTFSGPLDRIKLWLRPYTEGAYADDTMTVHQVPIFAQLKDTGTELSPSPPQRPPSPGGEQIGRPAGNGEGTAKGESLVVAFICKLHPKKGRFLVLEAKALGLPVGTAAMGPLISALKDGKSITHEGREVTPQQVCSPTVPGPAFIIVECPSEEFIRAVVSDQQLRRYQTGGTEDPAALVVHMTPERVLKTERYQKWMERFPSTTEHLILNEHVCTVHNARSHGIQAQLHMIHPEIFPPLGDYRPKESQADLNIRNVRGECLLKFQLRPVMEWQRDAVFCDTNDFVKEASALPNFLAEVDRCREAWIRRFGLASLTVQTISAAGPGEKYPEVVFTGTGSAVPMKMRNVSGTLVNISPHQSLLLDCGEGTFGQLCRHYGDDVDEVLSRISTVFISHMHADHHTGLPMLLFQRKRALRATGGVFSPVFLLGPAAIVIWLQKYHDSCEEILDSVNFISNNALQDGGETPAPGRKACINALLKKNNLEKFQTCAVRHCKNAYACSFTHQSGWKLAFSGDTMPCDAFVRIGRNANLLIHEATLEDGLEEEAEEKRHSTTSQAIGVGMKMNADYVLLNHFSQRYAKIPLFSEDFTERVGISFDHMRICFGDLKTLPRLMPVLKVLFAEDLVEMEERRDRRELRSLRGAASEMNGEQPVSDASRGVKRDQEEAREETKRLKAD